MIHLLMEFIKEVLHNGLIPHSGGDVFSENTQDVLKHLLDDKSSLLLLELLWLLDLFWKLEIDPVLKAIFRLSFQLLQKLQTGQTAAVLLPLGLKQVVA